MSADTLAAEFATTLVGVYRDVMAVAAHNIGVMEAALPAIGQARIREKHDELINRQLATLEQMGAAIARLDAQPDTLLNSLLLGALGMSLISCHYEAQKLAPQLNLKDFPELWTDAQILAVVRDPRYPTRAEQAARLGMPERSLYRRLEKLKG